MALVTVCKEITAVACGLNVNWQNGDLSSFQSFTMPAPILPRDQRNLQENVEYGNVIKSICFSEDGKYFCAMTSYKQMCILNANDFSILHHSMLPRAASKIRFSSDSEYLLVADKTGDALIFQMKNLDQGGRKFLGHLSLLIDVLLSRDNKFVITCDRDEKIRVSCFPNTYTIESFCMGHKEFITSIDFLPHNEKYLISSSGDGTIKVWDYLVGKEICTVDANETLYNSDTVESFQTMMKKEDVEVDCLPISYTSCCKIDEHSSLIAASLYLYRNILIYKISGEGAMIIFDIFHTVTLQSDPTSFFLTRDKLWICFQNNGVELRESSIKKNEESDVKVHKLSLYSVDTKVEIGENLLPSARDTPILVLYKRKFDNLRDYHERKKQRLEGQPK